MNKIALIVVLIFATSCSYLIESYEKDVLSEQDINPKEKTKNTTCKIIQKNIYLNENDQSQKVFDKYLKDLSKRGVILKFIDKTILWSLVQTNLRPDLNSPSAKLQVIIRLKNAEKYYNAYLEDDKGWPYFYLLEHLLKTYKSRYSLSQLIQYYDDFYPNNFVVSAEFENFLNENKGSLKKYDSFKNTYFRGDDTLRENERIPKLRLKKFYTLYKKTKKKKNYQIKEFLFSYKANTSFVPQCNFDMNLYDNSIFLINKKKISSNIFGLKVRNNAFMAVSSQYLKNIKPLNGTHFLSGYSHQRSASICVFKNRFKPDHNLWLVSSESRDPGQHLYHLLEYGVDELKSISELDSMLKFSRHLFLKNPVRLVFESRRSDKKQVEELLKLDIPIYNAKSLGKIWGYYKNSYQSSFLLDSRRQGALTCNSL